ncbi:MAG TPA: hypothetical protein VFO63_10350, partial [Blastocatellia bacterium]|nr:hypothetical protein [Blastocatellia bacterium]
MTADFKKANREVIDGARDSRAITQKQLVLALAGIFILNLLLRVFYIRYDFVNGDEGVRALTAL